MSEFNYLYMGGCQMEELEDSEGALINLSNTCEVDEEAEEDE